MDADVIVVGGGPIGMYVASQVAKEGYEVIVLEEHAEIGNPSHCSGLFSTKIFQLVPEMGILHPARKAVLHAPNGRRVTIGDERIRGYVVDRVEFDRGMARLAAKEGAHIFLKERVKRVSYPEVLTSKGRYRGRVIVGADGINSVVRRSLGYRLPTVIGAAQVIARGDVGEEDTVDIFLGSNYAPGFFAWRIPLFDGLVKIGLASYRGAWSHLKKLLKDLGTEPLSISGGGIPIGMVERSYATGILLVGDAAGQVKATSGGGYTQVSCAPGVPWKPS